MLLFNKLLILIFCLNYVLVKSENLEMDKSLGEKSFKGNDVPEGKVKMETPKSEKSPENNSAFQTPDLNPINQILKPFHVQEASMMEAKRKSMTNASVENTTASVENTTGSIENTTASIGNTTTSIENTTTSTESTTTTPKTTTLLTTTLDDGGVAVIPCWSKAEIVNSSDCNQKPRKPGYMSYFFEEYNICKEAKKNINTDTMIADDDNFVEHPDLNTFRHYLGFRNALLCTLNWNVVTKKITFGVFNSRLSTDTSDMLMYSLCRKFDIHLDPQNDKMYDPLAILSGCACSGTGSRAFPVATTIRCCCIPRAFDYTLKRISGVTRLEKFMNNKQ